MKFKCFLVILLVSTISADLCAQVASAASPWKTYDKDGYIIEYPAEWEANPMSEGGVKFAILSPLADKTDSFRENINLLIQDVSAYNLDLDAYAELSKQQIETIVEGGKVHELQKIEKDGKMLYEMVYVGIQSGVALKWKQYYWVENGTASVLTYTATSAEYDNYLSTATQMMDGFKFKK